MVFRLEGPYLDRLLCLPIEIWERLDWWVAVWLDRVLVIACDAIRELILLLPCCYIE